MKKTKSDEEKNQKKEPRSYYRRVNAALCAECLTPIISIFRHHFVACKCEDDGIAVDGGFDYWRRIGNPKKFREIDLYIKHQGSVSKRSASTEEHTVKRGI